MNEKQFFDWLRLNQDDLKLSQQMVDGANELIAIMGTEKTQTLLSKINGWQDFIPFQVSDKAIAMINAFEGFRANPYRDIANVATIGYGSTYYIKDGKRIANKLRLIATLVLRLIYYLLMKLDKVN